MPQENASVADGLVGMMNVFVDPAATAKRVPAPWFWVWPILVLSIVHLVVGYLMLPYTLQFVDVRMAQNDVPAEQLERAKSMTHLFSHVAVFLTPLFIVGFIALTAWLTQVACSVVGIRSRFRDLFSLIAACSLISMLQNIASYIVLKTKGDEITSAEQLQPPFGLDIFLGGLHGPAFAFLNFFSIFEIWFLVVLVLGLSYLTGCSKTKALIAVTPAWLIPLLFRLVGSLFQK